MPLAVCATPIGNLEDVTLRVLAELREADVVLCEDTRHTGCCSTGTASGRGWALVPRAQRGARTAELLPRLASGERIALVSDAGLPGVSTTPGAGSCSAALDAGVSPSRCCPGPSAVETALVASGLVADQYRFLGFLPRGEKRLAALWQELRGWPWPAVAFESPQRLPATLRSLAAVDARAGGCRLPRADEAVRGGRARDGRPSSRSASPSRRRVRSRSCSGRRSRDDGEGDAARARGRRRARGGRRAAAAGGRDRLRSRLDLARNRLYKQSL